ncbi:hypothetical protein [Streptomyces sp. NPDC053755]|uniref:hypothetical protein n=1 Tax=Streptomyces sp. NPDC053755 TaxID=3155815 RepID=UPI0034351D0E
MPSASIAAPSAQTTVSELRNELPRLEQRQQELEKDLAAVSERVNTVRNALTALLALAETPAPLAVEQEAAPAVENGAEPQSDSAPENTDTVAPAESTTLPAPRKATKSRSSSAQKATKTSARKERAAAKPSRAKAAAPKKPAAAPQDAGSLTEQVAAVLLQNPDTPQRARDVAKAVGRDSSAGEINTVRSTLDRLIASSRAVRAGRGLYQAPGN